MVDDELLGNLKKNAYQFLIHQNRHPIINYTRTRKKITRAQKNNADISCLGLYFFIVLLQKQQYIFGVLL